MPQILTNSSSRNNRRAGRRSAPSSQKTPLNTSFDTNAASFTYFDNSDFDTFHNQSNIEHNESSDNWGWDSIASPSSLNSFDYPRKTKTTINSNQPGVHNRTNNESHPTHQNSSHNTSSQSQELLNPTKLVGHVPFRSRFANAALVSQRLNQNHDDDNNDNGDPILNFFQHEEDPQIPTDLILNHNQPHNNKSINSATQNHVAISIDGDISSFLSQSKNEWPTSPIGEESFESFGNHSVFSDITGSITSPKSSRRRGKYHDTTTTSETLLQVQEEEDNDKFNDVNKTASTHLESSYYNSDNGEEEDNDESDHSNRLNDENLGNKSKRGNKPRLASLFVSRANANGQTRSQSVPKSRIKRGSLDYSDSHFTSSPPRSYASGSSYSDYVGWPGTIAKDGHTIPVTSSFSDDGLEQTTTNKSNITTSTNQNKLEEQRKQSSHDVSSLTDLKMKQAEIRKNSRFGRKLFGRKSGKTSDKKKRDDNSQISQLRQQVEGDIVDLDEVPSSDEENTTEPTDQNATQNPADIYLAKVVSRATSASPVNVPGHDINTSSSGVKKSSYSKLDESKIVRSGQRPNNESSVIDVSASLRRVRSALSPQSLGSIPEGEVSFRLSEEALKMNERLSPVRSNASGANVRGFRGFLDKTKDVPNLIDDETDSCTTASTRATERNLIKRTEIGDWQPPYAQSDVFDGVESVTGHSYIHHGKKLSSKLPSEENVDSTIANIKKNPSSTADSEDEVNLVRVNTSLTTIQATMTDFNKRITSADFDANLTESDTDFLPSGDERRMKNNDGVLSLKTKMMSPIHQAYRPSTSDSDSESSASSSSLPSISSQRNIQQYNLSMYAIDPSKVRKMVKRFRTLSNKVCQNAINEDCKKAFALFEMRSRIMESDIERGIDRRGWTKVVDDIVLTPYFQASNRVRDAVIVSKAWREGASPSDARTAFFLTAESSSYHHLDNVLWCDDTDIFQLRCPCPDNGTLRGFDIFTEGDCQSMLLQLTNEYCDEIRTRLRDASSRQIIAEHIMKEEAECDVCAMTEAEDAYLEAMEEVKTLTTTLSIAENAFNMTKKKIEDLVSKYENMLGKINNSPAKDDDSNCGDDDLTDDNLSVDTKAKEKLTRRAQRAELKAEVASREAEMAKIEAEKSKKEVEMIRIQKENELAALQKRLDELEAKSALMESFEGNMQKQAAFSVLDESFKSNSGARTSLLYAASTIGDDQDNNEAKARMKAKFRQRRLTMKESSNLEMNVSDKLLDSVTQKRMSNSVEQRLQFYERSLQSVERK